VHSKKDLDERLKAAGISPLKHLGQNFLLNPNICQKIIQAVRDIAAETVVEVGPGLGALTDSFLEGDENLTLIELDQGLVEFWNKKFEGFGDKKQIIHCDALKFSWDQIDFKKPTCLMSNLPYSIAASMVIEISGLKSSSFDRMVLMFQKEVAERFQAGVNTEDYAMPSVVAQAFWKIEKLIDAGPQDFFPVPHVGSRVLVFDRKETKVANPRAFVSFVKQAFSQRRKKMINNLSTISSPEAIEKALASLGYSTDVRAQEVTVENFISLYWALKSE
jgi:16S rRNA (adenine1518-N6/adenine1519-N6)-dimethyltransferase